MRDQVARKIELEESKNGLIIVEAIYGKLPPSTVPRTSHPMRGLSFQFKSFFEADSAGVNTPPHLEGRASEAEMENVTPETAEEGGAEDAAGEEKEKEYIDVRIPVQGLVVNSQLHISGGHSKVCGAAPLGKKKLHC
jgi:DnaJ family protein C protein 11